MQTTTAYSPLDLGAALGKFEELQSVQMIDLPAPSGLPMRQGARFAAIPKGLRVEDLSSLIEKHLERPARIREQAVLTTADSLIDYAKRFKKPASALFADTNPEGPSLTALIDWHGEGTEAEPDFVTHQAIYRFPLSDQFMSWLAASVASRDPKTMMDQASFAHFLQDHLWDIDNPPADWMMLEREHLDLVLELLNLRDDIGERGPNGEYLTPPGIDPDGHPDDEDEAEPPQVPRTAIYKLRRMKIGGSERIAQLANGIEITVDQKVVSRFDPRSGMKELSFAEEHTGINGSKIKIPQLMLIRIPVFDRGRQHLLPVRLFYRIMGGRVFWGVELLKAGDLIRRAVETAAQDAATRTGLPLFFGTAPTGG